MGRYIEMSSAFLRTPVTKRAFPVKDSGTAEHAARLVLEICDHEETAVVRCSGRICFRNEALQFSRAVTDLLKSGQNVILDLSGVELLDSAGLGELVLAHMQAQAAGNQICLAAPISRVHALLELTNIASLFEIYPTVEDAQASLAVHAA
jgi:anti-sigma B factor antagonist